MYMDFQPIIQLKLKEAFSDNSNFQKIKNIKDSLNELFECDNRGKLFAYDDADIGHTVYIYNTKGLGSDRVFIILNKMHRDVFLWHIDGVLFKKNSKCDCAVLTNQELVFIEFKSEALNQTKEAIQTNYEKASEQILITYKEVCERCNAVGVELVKMVKIKAFAVFNRSVPQNDALRKNLSAKFLMESKGVKLFFDNNTTII